MSKIPSSSWRVSTLRILKSSPANLDGKISLNNYDCILKFTIGIWQLAADDAV